MNLHLGTACLSLFFGATAIAQTTIVLPAEYDRAWGRGSSAVLGGNVTHTQIVFANPFPANTAVFGIGFRDTTRTTDALAFQAEIEVQVSSTAAVPGAFSSTFAANVGSDVVTAFPRQFVTIPARRANRGTGEFAQILFPTPFIFGTNGQPNILFDVYVYSRSTGASWSTDRGFATTSGRVTNVGIGCGAGTITSTSTGGTYVAGASVTISLAGATPNSTSLLMYSFDEKEFAPGVPLPFPLATLGSASNCELLLEPSQGFSLFGTSATGASSATFVIPAFAQVGVGVQWGYFITPTAANPFGLEVTANRAIWLGPEVCWPNSGYIYDLSTTTAATGTASTNAVPVMQIIKQ